MRYLITAWLALLLFFPAFAKPAPRAAHGKRSSMTSVRKKTKYNRKPNVYSAKKNRPLVAKKPHWWQRR